MLYNKNWNKPARDIHSLDSLIDWLGQQCSSKRYPYYNGYGCLLTQYYTDMGLTGVMVGVKFYIANEACGDLPDGFNAIAKGNLFTRFFGLALKRALKLKKVRSWNTEYCQV